MEGGNQLVVSQAAMGRDWHRVWTRLPDSGDKKAHSGGTLSCTDARPTQVAGFSSPFTLLLPSSPENPPPHRPKSRTASAPHHLHPKPRRHSPPAMQRLHPHALLRPCFDPAVPLHTPRTPGGFHREHDEKQAVVHPHSQWHEPDHQTPNDAGSSAPEKPDRLDRHFHTR